MKLTKDINDLLREKGYFTLANDLDFGKKVATIVAKSLREDTLLRAAAIGRSRDSIARIIERPIRWTDVDKIATAAIDKFIEVVESEVTL